MLINDLAHLETLALDSTLNGGANLALEATAFAAGSITYALTDTDVLLRTVPSGKVTIGRGRGYALAIGDIHYTNVAYSADGFDKVIVKERLRQTKHSSSTKVRILALDLPH
jgi:hypothetical protein